MSSPEGRRTSGQVDNGAGPSHQHSMLYSTNANVGVGPATNNPIMVQDWATHPHVTPGTTHPSGLSAQANTFAPAASLPVSAGHGIYANGHRAPTFQSHSNRAPMGTSSSVTLRTQPELPHHDTSALAQPFTDEVPGGQSRYVVLSIDQLRLRREGLSLEDAYSLVDMSAFNNAIVHPGMTRPFVLVNGGNTLIFAFDALSDAEQAIQDPVMNTLGARRYLEVHDYFRQVGLQDRREIANRYEGQVLVTVSPTSAERDSNKAWSSLLHWIDILLGSSDLRAIRQFKRTAITATFRLELDRLMTATSILKNGSNSRRYNNAGCEYVVEVSQYRPEAYDPIERRQRALQSPLTHNMPTRQNHAHNVNVVDEEKILLGQDVRTTVMVRNIPNQMTTYELEAILVSHIPGKYDFIYLRIDFHAMSNVGYAFVNLESPLDIYNLNTCLKRHGWGNMETKKSPALSYATVQGREALIEKFRNSSVMEEGLDCRPRLFYTQTEAQKHAGDGWQDLTGVEQPFPSSNNTAKLERSRQNAETQGLWASNHRQKPGQPPHYLDPGNPRATSAIQPVFRGQGFAPQNPSPRNFGGYRGNHVPATFAPHSYMQPGLGAAMNAYNGHIGGPYAQPSHMVAQPVPGSYGLYQGHNAFAVNTFGHGMIQQTPFPSYPAGQQYFNHSQFNTFGNGTPAGHPTQNVQSMRPRVPTATVPGSNGSALAGRSFQRHGNNTYGVASTGNQLRGNNQYGIGATGNQAYGNNPYGIGAGESSKHGNNQYGIGATGNQAYGHNPYGIGAGESSKASRQPSFSGLHQTDLAAPQSRHAQAAPRPVERATRHESRGEQMAQGQVQSGSFRPLGDNGELFSGPSAANIDASPRTPVNTRPSHSFITPSQQIQHGTPVCPPRPENSHRHGLGIGPSAASTQGNSGSRLSNGMQSPGQYGFGGHLRGAANTDRGAPSSRFGGNLHRGNEDRSNDTDRSQFSGRRGGYN